ncbi:HD domain-containing protein [Acidicapsa ligni]|uniref:HD domain-containing protein n=1 Tax=Acidicapsa ligni TaxID=542300 RepID=UPI0021E00A11|nr:HD domain-containing protein [Acidicapsa ligni]
MTDHVTDRIKARSWRESVVEYIRVEATPADKFGHQPRLYALAQQIAKGQDCDDDVLFAAAWMHDLGVFIGHRPSDPVELARWDHVPYTISRSRELLPQWGFPAEKLEVVAETIRTHEAKYTPLVPEAVVLRDADILEQLGAIGALRAFVKVGRDTRYATYSDVIPVLERALTVLPGLLQLEVSRELARERVAALRSLLEAIRAEAAGNLH